MVLGLLSGRILKTLRASGRDGVGIDAAGNQESRNDHDHYVGF